MLIECLNDDCYIYILDVNRPYTPLVSGGYLLHTYTAIFHLEVELVLYYIYSNIYILAYVYIAVDWFPALYSGWDPIAPPIKRIIFYKSHIPRYSISKRNWYCANVCGCRETGWRDPTGFLTNIYLISYIVIFDCYHGWYMMFENRDWILMCCIIGSNFWS